MRRTSRSAAALLTLTAALAAGTAVTPAYAAESPVIDMGLAPGQRVNKTVTIKPTIADGADVTRIRLYVNGQAVTEDASAPWSMSWNTIYLFEGHHRIQLGLLDSQGNWTLSETVTVVVINHAPAAYFPWPSSTQRDTLNTFNGVKEFDFNLSTRENLDTVIKVDLLRDGQVIDSTSSAPWTVTWDTSGPDGMVELRSRTYDTLGNITTTRQYAHVDRTPPALAVNYDETDGYVSRTGTISIISSDPSTLDRVELLINGHLVRTDRSICCGRAGAVRLPWDPAAVNGPATMTVRSYDTVGNLAEHTRTVIVDNDRPVITVSPAANAHVRGVFTTAATAVKDSTGLVYMGASIGDLAYTHRAPWNVRLDSRQFGDGRRTLMATVVDKAGNQTVVQQPITVDNTAPTIKYTKAPKNNAKVTRAFKVTAAAADRFGVARVQLLVNGKVVATDSRAAYTFTVNPKKYSKKFTVQVRAYDKAGNVKYTTKRAYRR